MSDHRFELLVLVGIFAFSCVMLACFHTEEMARWIEGGAVITVIARGMGGNRTALNAPTEPIKNDPTQEKTL